MCAQDLATQDTSDDLGMLGCERQELKHNLMENSIKTAQSEH